MCSEDIRHNQVPCELHTVVPQVQSSSKLYLLLDSTVQVMAMVRQAIARSRNIEDRQKQIQEVSQGHMAPQSEVLLGLTAGGGLLGDDWLPVIFSGDE